MSTKICIEREQSRFGHTSLFVHQDLRAHGLSMALIGEAARRQHRALGEGCFGVFGVFADNDPMLRFVRSRMELHLISRRESYGACKQL